MLRIAFRRCHNFIHGNGACRRTLRSGSSSTSSSPRSMTSGRSARVAGPRFRIDSQDSPPRRPGRRAVPRAAVLQLFREVKENYKKRGSSRAEEITMSVPALTFMVS